MLLRVLAKGKTFTSNYLSDFQRSPRYAEKNPFFQQQQHQQQRPNPNMVANEVKTTRTLVHPERLFKVVIVGDSAVGKSSLINRFCQGQFVPSFNATIGRPSSQSGGKKGEDCFRMLST